MRILYNNLLESASLSATNEDSNYPIGNVVDTTLLSEFRATANGSTITCTLAEASTVSAFAFGNHNIDTLQITLTDSSSGTTVYNYTSSDLKFSDEVTQKIIYETPVSDVVEIEYMATSVFDLYIGGLSAGGYLQMPLFDIEPKIGFESSGKRQKSRGGVTFNVPGVVLETFRCVFNAVSVSNYREMNAFFADVQVYKPFFVDRWEESDAFPALFAQIVKNTAWNKGPEGLIFDSFRLELEECK